MSQQSNYVEKNVAEESAAMASQEAVSITIPIIISVICTYFFIFFPRKPAPIPLMMRKRMVIKPHKEEQQRHHLPPVTM